MVGNPKGPVSTGLMHMEGSSLSRQKVVESLVVRVSKGYLLLVADARPVSDIEVEPPPSSLHLS